jgi:hypothetical protein
MAIFKKTVGHKRVIKSAHNFAIAIPISKSSTVNNPRILTFAERIIWILKVKNNFTRSDIARCFFILIVYFYSISYLRK